MQGVWNRFFRIAVSHQMAWTPHILEDRPVLRERVLGLTAISAVLLGGAMAMNSIVTGGWQWGAAQASTHQLYYDDVEQHWSEPAPSAPISRPVALARADFINASNAANVTPEQAAAQAGALEGNAATVSLTSYAPGVNPQPLQQTLQPTPAQSLQQTPPVDDEASKRRFDQLEADIAQANHRHDDGQGGGQDDGQDAPASDDDGAPRS
jgi:hypothetical protein